MTQELQVNDLKALFNQSKQQALDDYFCFLKFPSISSEPHHQTDIINCIEWLKKYLESSGFDTQIWSTSGHPVLFASYLKAGPDKPTLLIYNHYDVQPVDPLDLWQTPPFEPTLRDGNIYARGAQDNKGQCFYTLFALKKIIEAQQSLPINIKLCIEGEEECGSHGLAELLSSKAKDLKADYLAVIDVGLPKEDQPAITLGLRGMTSLEVELVGSNTDLHSGSHGGIAYNPNHAIVSMLANLRDKEGTILVDDFYADVQPFSEEDRKQITFQFDPEEYIKKFGAYPFGGEKSYSPLERCWIRPSLEINGVWGGYTGTGFKTVIPAKASAKISCRLVPNQEPQKIAKLVKAYLEKIKPEGFELTVHLHPGGGKAVRTDPSTKGVQAFAKAFEEIYQKPCEFILEGASIPIVPQLAQASNADLILLGLGLDSDKIHAPNEHFGLDRIEKGFILIGRAIQMLAKL